MERQAAARAIFEAALAAVAPGAAVRRECARLRALCPPGRRVLLVAAGKAAAPMAAALLEEGLRPAHGVLVTKRGHLGDHAFPPGIELHEAGHPLPDAASVAAAGAVLRMLGSVGRDDLVVVALSGGASALLAGPAPGLTLADKQRATELLLRAGAEIQELNAVRKHLSTVKGGRLAERIAPAAAEVLVLSDVLGDRLDVIASGPLAPDPTTAADALEILARRGVLAAAGAVRDHLERCARGELPETPKPGAPAFERVHSVIVAGNGQAVDAAAAQARRAGFRAEIVSRALRGEASAVGRELAARARALRARLGPGERVCWVAGGETTVTVRGSGRGGRNTELAAAFAREIAGTPGVTCLSGGTDGTDGPTDAAGAIADGGTVPAAAARGLDVDAALAGNDTYGFFQRAGGLLVTGPTGTNVMDLQLVLLEGPPAP